MLINKTAVKTAMKKKNISTQTELAERLRMNKSQLSQMLSEGFSPIKTNVLKLMKELDISYKEIIIEETGDGMPTFSNAFIVAEPTEQLDLFETNTINRFDYRLDEYEDVRNTVPQHTYTLVETFAGAGGLSLGLEQAGLDSIADIELDHQACETLRHNRPTWNVMEEDINEIARLGIRNHKQFNFDGELDVLSGGYPCQSFSYAGLRHGLDDTRGTLFYPYSQLLNQLQPKVFIAENVKGLVNHDNGRTLETMIQVFEEAGYHVVWNILNAWNYSVAQKRERIVIIGIRNDLYQKQKKSFKFPKSHVYKPVLNDILRNVPKSLGATYPQSKVKILDLVPPGGCWVDLPDEIAKKYMGASYNSGGGRRGMARRLSWNEPSLTLTTSPAQKQTERCHPEKTRPFTIREYARIQSFPDSWQFVGSMGNQYKQIGNAVPVNLAKAIGQSVINYLNQF
ncbi:DNA (cytosine-5-)-methyltransferase [Sporolactobacillus spathodeae]|uniref:Cytosine-specific methyltransferase n=1 Tax=Sporolactobacillus spathodeae TaxID=1465502 RepID=A0ABS2Q9E2_9BACL|nr:DNA (cytosine-5-)-methyltransferase [Sporolactobacillus spathodeae]MBM7658412.1 DNA (cytosine-5)-methyltransferase 1 [Sporolactobacillus spathodeae]